MFTQLQRERFVLVLCFAFLPIKEHPPNSDRYDAAIGVLHSRLYDSYIYLLAALTQ